MKLIAPIRSLQQYPILKESGAQELYGGIWLSESGRVSEYNRRGNFGEQANFTDFNELAQVIEYCCDDGIPFYLTMNAIYTPVAQKPLIRDILKHYRACGGKKVIVSNEDMLTLAREADCEITISSCAGISNRFSAEYWVKAGAERLILPRSVTFAQIRSFRQYLPANVEIETFMMNTMCKFSDSMCRSLHNTEYGALCAFIDHSQKKYVLLDGQELTGREAIPMCTNGYLYQQLYTGNKSFGCGHCALWELFQAGVDSVKIVGRLLDADVLANQIRLTRRNMQIAAECHSKDEYLHRMESVQRLMGNDICRNGFQCYYREARTERHA